MKQKIKRGQKELIIYVILRSHLIIDKCWKQITLFSKVTKTTINSEISLIIFPFVYNFFFLFITGRKGNFTEKAFNFIRYKFSSLLIEYYHFCCNCDVKIDNFCTRWSSEKLTQFPQRVLLPTQVLLLFLLENLMRYKFQTGIWETVSLFELMVINDFHLLLLKVFWEYLKFYLSRKRSFTLLNTPEIFIHQSRLFGGIWLLINGHSIL